MKKGIKDNLAGIAAFLVATAVLHFIGDNVLIEIYFLGAGLMGMYFGWTSKKESGE